MDIIGLGTQDDLEYARDFVGSFDLPFPMLWDESGDSWAALQVPRQPVVMLFTAEGELIDEWQGAIPEEEVLGLVAEQA